MCVTQDQLDACAASLDTCDGTCHDGVCLANACGNDLLDEQEVCDLGAQNGLTDGDARCSLDCTSTMVCGNQLVDVAVGETCDQGDFASHDGCSSSCDAETVAFYRLLPRPPELDRSQTRIAYDARRRRTVLFGGGLANSNQGVADTFEWDGVTWAYVPTRVQPPGRAQHAMVYDSARERVVLFSGTNGSNDTWTYDGQWRPEDAPGERPTARSAAGFAFDAKRAVAVLFGGYDLNQTIPYIGDTWEWNGEAWTKVSPAASPPARSQPAMAYDPVRGVVVLFGGLYLAGGITPAVHYADTWEYDGTTWTPRTVTGPDRRAGASMSWDPARKALLLTGGSSDVLVNGVYTRRDTWAYDGTAWSEVTSAAGNAEVTGSYATTDTVRGIPQRYTSLNHLLEWNGTQWAQPAGDAQLPTVPSQAMYQGMVATDRELVAFGGANKDPFVVGAATLYANTQIFDGDWRGITTTQPSARFLPAMAYDAKRKQVVLVSGCTGSDASTDAVDDQGTWLFANGAWTKLSVTTPVECGAAMAYDSTRDQVILYGGERLNGSAFLFSNDTFAWNGSSWQQLAPATRPPKGWRGVMAEDPIHKHLVLYAGFETLNTGFGLADFSHGDTWIWDGTTWTKAANAGAPLDRYSPTLAWNPARQRLTLIDGAVKSTFVMVPDPNMAEWDGARWNVVPASSGRTARYAAPGAPWRDGVAFVGGGTDATTPRNDLVLARYDSDAPSETCSLHDTDGDGLASCADSDCWYTCTPSCMPGLDCTAAEKLCGNGTCDAVENCAVCEQDCNACAAVCGNFVCDSGESTTSCPGDCLE